MLATRSACTGKPAGLHGVACKLQPAGMAASGRQAGTAQQCATGQISTVAPWQAWRHSGLQRWHQLLSAPTPLTPSHLCRQLLRPQNPGQKPGCQQEASVFALKSWLRMPGPFMESDESNDRHVHADEQEREALPHMQALQHGMGVAACTGPTCRWLHNGCFLDWLLRRWWRSCLGGGRGLQGGRDRGRG